MSAPAIKAESPTSPIIKIEPPSPVLAAVSHVPSAIGIDQGGDHAEHESNAIISSITGEVPIGSSVAGEASKPLRFAPEAFNAWKAAGKPKCQFNFAHPNGYCEELNCAARRAQKERNATANKSRKRSQDESGGNASSPHPKRSKPFCEACHYHHASNPGGCRVTICYKCHIRHIKSISCEDALEQRTTALRAQTVLAQASSPPQAALPSWSLQGRTDSATSDVGFDSAWARCYRIAICLHCLPDSTQSGLEFLARVMDAHHSSNGLGENAGDRPGNQPGSSAN